MRRTTSTPMTLFYTPHRLQSREGGEEIVSYDRRKTSNRLE